MCEINPKHSAFFKLEAFTSNPDMSEKEFTNEVMQRLFDVEQQLNADGRFRFHIHEIPAAILTHGDNRKCPEVQSGAWLYCRGHKQQQIPRERAARKPNAGATT